MANFYLRLWITLVVLAGLLCASTLSAMWWRSSVAWLDAYRSSADGQPFPIRSCIVCAMWIVPAVVYWAMEVYSRVGTRAVSEPAASKNGLAAPHDVETQRLSCLFPHETLSESSDSSLSDTSIDLPITVLYASLEHRLPGLPDAKAVAGGLGKVTALIAEEHPTDIVMVSPMVNDADYHALVPNFEESIEAVVDGETHRVHVHGMAMKSASGKRYRFLMLRHPLFEKRDKDSIYPNPMSRRQVLQFFSLWNQAVGKLIVRHNPEIYHCPDFHTAVAPWYAVNEAPNLKVLLTLHNAEYQGQISTDMIYGSLNVR